jgi:glycosyltransferase 2 family protein
LSSIEPSVEITSQARAARKKRLILALQIVLMLVVLAFVGRQLQSSMRELAQRNVSLRDIQWPWLILAGAAYAASILPAAAFFHMSLVAMGNRPRVWRSFRAFLIGGVGKYIPGKAAVVFLRTVLVAGPSCTAGAAGVAVFIETLTLMGVGGFLAAIVLMLLFRDQWWIALLSVGLAVVVIVPTIPRVTRSIAKAIRLQKLSGDIHERLAGWNMSLIAKGWVLQSGNWLFLTLTVWICLRALPASFFENQEQLAAAQSFTRAFPLMLVATSISTVLGFLLFIPAGLGVREIVVLNLLAPAIGYPAATTVSVLSRVAMIVVDVLIAAVLYSIPAPDLPSISRDTDVAASKASSSA